MASKDETQVLMLGRQTSYQLSSPASLDKILKNERLIKGVWQSGNPKTQEHRATAVTPGSASL